MQDDINNGGFFDNSVCRLTLDCNGWQYVSSDNALSKRVKQALERENGYELEAFICAQIKARGGSWVNRFTRCETTFY